ncbi:uncharacterized protein LOC113494119 isoform X2 [Trichoplusia ni]|uniref:Uncharacterized protein LOC113494119 isoform X2 n=1 Tax=Trichoplusia ni TaxID=7111 RepID=A0A7E5VIC0_TRINI|nr:uncharacterized protein LOC113494119 isoform X2 [Trichoplusia ni]
MTSVTRRREHEDSGEYSDASQEIELNNSVNDGGQQESDYDSQGSDSEHSDQDPENKTSCLHATTSLPMLFDLCGVY